MYNLWEPKSLILLLLNVDKFLRPWKLRQPQTLMEGGMSNEAGGVGVWTNQAGYTVFKNQKLNILVFKDRIKFSNPESWDNHNHWWRVEWTMKLVVSMYELIRPNIQLVYQLYTIQSLETKKPWFLFNFKNLSDLESWDNHKHWCRVEWTMKLVVSVYELIRPDIQLVYTVYHTVSWNQKALLF